VYIEAIAKTGFWFKIKAAASFNPLRLLAVSSSRTRKYVEGSKREPRADIGSEDIFAITSNLLSPTPQRRDRIRRGQATGPAHAVAVHVLPISFF